MMDNVELQAACAALGYLDGDAYHKEPDCLGRIVYFIIHYFVMGRFSFQY